MSPPLLKRTLERPSATSRAPAPNPDRGCASAPAMNHPSVDPERPLNSGLSPSQPPSAVGMPWKSIGIVGARPGGVTSLMTPAGVTVRSLAGSGAIVATSKASEAGDHAKRLVEMSAASGGATRVRSASDTI